MKSNSYKFRIYWNKNRVFNKNPDMKGVFIIIYLYKQFRKINTIEIAGQLKDNVFESKTSKELSMSMDEIIHNNNKNSILKRLYCASGSIVFPNSAINHILEELCDGNRYRFLNKEEDIAKLLITDTIVFESIYKYGKFYGKKEKIREE